jgi:cyclopropane fatty-acyl-phospholipid synthase-like methyltransferase
MEQSMKEFWDSKHKDDSILSLTGSSANQVIEILDIKNRISKGIKLLEIGVGLGICTRELVNKDIDVYCLDISQVALDRVKPFARGLYLAEDLPKLPTNFFDLAISTFVAQHMTNKDLQEQLNHVISSLKDDGVFAFQYIIPFRGREISETRSELDHGGVSRTVEEMNEMVSLANGYSIFHKVDRLFPQFKMCWGIFHAKRIK